MPNSKNFFTRLCVLDRCLGSGHAYTGKELIGFINRELEAHCEPPISSRNTLMEDLMRIENEFNISILRVRHGRQTTYQYEKTGFTIFSSKILKNDFNHLEQALAVLSYFKGMPQLDWITQLNANMCLLVRQKQTKSIVGFETSIKGIEHFAPLFNAILKRTTVVIQYQSFKIDKPQTLIIHPYYLKQYNNRWFLFCSTGEHTSISHYSLDCILSVKEANVPYRDTMVNFEAFFDDVIGINKSIGQKPEKILLRFPKEQYKHVTARPWHDSQIVLEEKEDYVIIQLNVIHNYELEQKILSFGDYVEVIAPKNLRSKIEERLENAKKQYKEM